MSRVLVFTRAIELESLANFITGTTLLPGDLSKILNDVDTAVLFCALSIVRIKVPTAQKNTIVSASIKILRGSFGSNVAPVVVGRTLLFCGSGMAVRVKDVDCRVGEWAKCGTLKWFGDII